MKKLLLATAIAALSVSAANAAPTVYGKAFLTVDYLDGERTTTKGAIQSKNDINKSGLNSNGSRIGLKGSEALTANTDVVYKLEYGINIDEDNLSSKGQFYSRDTYLGLSNEEYGTMVAGRLTSIDDNIDFAGFLEGNNVADIGPTFNEERLDNAFAYFSPDYNGLSLMAMYAIDADTDRGSLVNYDQYGVGAIYSMGDAVELGATYIAYGEDSNIRVSAGYDMSDAIKLGAWYQLSEFSDSLKNPSPLGAGDDKESTITFGAEYSTPTPWTYYGQVTLIDNVRGVDNAEAMGVGGGAKYAFSKAATGHIYAGYADSEDGLANSESGKNEEDSYSIGGGLEYKF